MTGVIYSYRYLECVGALFKDYGIIITLGLISEEIDMFCINYVLLN